MVQEKTSAGIRFPIILMLILSVISGVVLGLSTGGFIVDFNELGFSVFSTAQRSVNSVSTSVGGVFTAVKQLATLKEEHAALTEKLKEEYK